MLDRSHDHLYFRIKAKCFQGYLAVDAIKILVFRIEACLAAASLKSRNYKEVVAQTYAALRCDGEIQTGCHEYCCHSYGYWLEEQKPDCLRIHYCRAMALYHLGNTVTATWHMEYALHLDPGDNDVFEKLTMLQQKLAEESQISQRLRNLRLEKLNSSQNQLRKKQARRRTRAQGQKIGVNIVDNNE